MGPYNVYPDPPEQRFYICPDRYDSDKDIDLAKPSSLIENGLEFPPLYLLDGYVHTPPSFKSYTIDIPGKNTKLDVTEQVYGDVRYENRTNEYELVMVLMDDEYPPEPYDDPPTKKYMLETRSRFEYYKSMVYNFLHGRSFFYCVNDERDDFKFRYTYKEGPSIRDTRWVDLMDESETWRLWIDGDKKNSTWKDIWEIKDPGARIKNYDSRVFHGRFSVESFEREDYGNGDLGRFKLKVDTDPYILYRNILPVVFTKEITIGEKGKHDTIWDEMIEDSTTWGYWTDRTVEWKDEWEREDKDELLLSDFFQNEEEMENPKSLIGGCMYNVFDDPEMDTDNSMPTRPVFQTPQDLTLIHHNKRYYLPKGTWAIPDLILTRSNPAFYLHAYPLHTMQWQEYTEGVFEEERPIADGKYTGEKITWKTFKKHRLYWWNRYHGWVEPPSDEIVSIYLDPEPTKKQYEIGEELNVEGMVVHGVYASGTERVLVEGEYEVGPLDTSTEGTKTVTVSCLLSAYPSTGFDVVVGHPSKHNTIWNEMISDSASWDYWTDRTVKWMDEWERDGPAPSDQQIQNEKKPNDFVMDINRKKEVIKYYDSSYPLNVQTWDNPTEYKEDGTLLTWGYYNTQPWFVHKNKDWWHFARIIDPRAIEDVIVHIERGCI